jgi:hypothetical protein
MLFFARSYESAAVWSGLSVEEIRRQVEAGTVLLVVVYGVPMIDTRTIKKVGV